MYYILYVPMYDIISIQHNPLSLGSDHYEFVSNATGSVTTHNPSPCFGIGIGARRSRFVRGDVATCERQGEQQQQ